MKIRVCEKLVDGKWEIFQVRNLKPGDVFKLSEGSKVIGTYEATSEPYLSEDAWTVDCDEVEIVEE